jgi:photosystem II stability/assembly factor-like uncharacterized protein
MRYFPMIIIFIVAAPILLWGEVWEPFSLEGQSVKYLAINPRVTKIMYAITGSGWWGKDLLKTMDGGETWRSMLGNLRHPTCIAVNPREPDRIYLGAGRLYKSTDGGETWDKGIAFHDPPVTIHQIVIHPADPNVMYVVRSRLNSALHRSTDGGEHWGMCSRLINEVGGLFLDVNPKDPDVVYVCGGACWFFAVGKSEDGGMNFTKLNLPGDPDGAITLAVAPSRPDTVYVMSFLNKEPCIFKSEDGGSTWEVLPTGIKTHYFDRLKVNPANSNLLYGITAGNIIPGQSRLFFSDDGGKSWRLFMDGMEGVEVSSVTFDPKRPWVLYSCTSGGIYRTEHLMKSVDVSPDDMKTTLWGYIRVLDSGL